ncbi:MAG TPA: hypothetical protein VFH89_03320 [Sphingomicrobium sp.]|nr:hypothetical protein [Sphingomicrobium sp.]
MTFDATGAEVRHSGAVGDSRPNDVALNADGSLIYASGSDGNLRVYNADSGELVQTIDVGMSLGAIDVSPDGSFLIAAELVPVETHSSGGGYPTYTVALYKVDLETGAVTTYEYEASYDNYTFKDVGVLANGDVLLIQSQPPGWSSWASLKTLNLDTGTFTNVASGPSIPAGSLLHPSEDGTQVLVVDTNISDAGLQLYESGVGVTADHSLYANNVSGFNSGLEAFSGPAGIVAQYVYGNGLHIYNASLEYQLNLFDLYPEWQSGAVSGLEFDSTGEYLFVLDNEDDTIVQLSTTDWSVVATFDVGADVGNWNGGLGDFANSLIIGPDIRYFTVVTDTGFIQVDNPNVSSTINGTGGADDITGTGLFDEIIADAGNDTLHGLGGNDILAGGVGNDVLDGGAGNDRLDGGAGDDQLIGGAGSDTADYRAAAAPVTVDLSIVGAQDTVGAGTDTLTSVENIDGTAFDDTLRGNGEANRLSGGAGSDLIVGGAGNDEINGGAGDDELDGGDGDDLVSYLGSTAAVDVSVAIGTAQNTGGSGTDTLSSFTNLRGSNFDDHLTGSAEGNLIYGEGGADELIGGDGNDFLDGGSGADMMSGGTGDDRFYVDNVADQVSELAGEGADEIYSTATFTLSANVENLRLLGGGSINGTGNAAANVILGNDGANRLTGLEGSDELRGGRGNDQLIGGTGNDLLGGGSGNDVLNGGAGVDVVDGESGSDIYVVMSASELAGDTLADTGSSGADEIRFASISSGSLTLSGQTGIERIAIGTGTAFLADRTGTAALNVDARAIANALLIQGNDGVNILYSTAYNDTVSGGAGDDRLITNAGDDIVDGGAGADRMRGGTGSDVYYVDNSGDYVEENAGEGTDLVYASIGAALRVNVENLTLTGAASINGRGNDLANTIKGNSGDNILYGNGGDDRLYGNDGNDRLDGGSGADRLYGGTGSDTYFVDNAGDVLAEVVGAAGTDRVYATVNYTLRADFENLTLTGSNDIVGRGNAASNVITGNSGANGLYGFDGSDTLSGNAGADSLDGGTGNDVLDGGLDADRLYGQQGNDILIGGEGNDWLEGGAGQDRQYGGSGADKFVFRTGDSGGLTGSTCDRIHDFSQADDDRIVISPIDADATLSGDQVFTFVGSNGFSGTAGELRYEQIGTTTFIQGDTNGDGIADFLIRLDGLHTLTTGDFIL